MKLKLNKLFWLGKFSDEHLTDNGPIIKSRNIFLVYL